MAAVSSNRSEVLEKIFSLPLEFRLRPNISLLRLVENTGYAGCPDQIDVSTIKQAIRGRHGLISIWFDYSREKSENWGWFLEGPDDGIYLVGSRTRSVEMPYRIRNVE